MEAKIIFADEKLKEAFESLKDSNEKFYNELERAFKEISENVYRGRNVKKKLIPKTLIQKYGVNNLWVYNLSSGWRLIYSAGNNEIEVLGIVLDWMSHKDYEKLFKF